MKSYIEHPGLLFGLLWAFWLYVAFGVSVLCIPVSFLTKWSAYIRRISRAVLWGTIPLVLLFLVSLPFDPQGDSAGCLLGMLVSCVPAVPALSAFLISGRKSHPAVEKRTLGKG